MLSQQTNFSWHARGTVSVVVIKVAKLVTEAAASVASMVDTPFIINLSVFPFQFVTELLTKFKLFVQSFYYRLTMKIRLV